MCAGEGYQQHSDQRWYASDSPAPPPTGPTAAYTPYTAHQGVNDVVGPNPTSSSPGYQHHHHHQQQQFSHQVHELPPTHQFQNQNLYQHQQQQQQISPRPSPEVAGTSQTQLIGGMQSPSGSNVNQLHPGPSVSPPPASMPGHSHSGERILFSIGGPGGSERNLGDLGGSSSSNFVREKGGSEMNLGIGNVSSVGGRGGSERNLGTSSSSRTGGVAVGGATGYSQVR